LQVNINQQSAPVNTNMHHGTLMHQRVHLLTCEALMAKYTALQTKYTSSHLTTSHDAINITKHQLLPAVHHSTPCCSLYRVHGHNHFHINVQDCTCVAYCSSTTHSSTTDLEQLQQHCINSFHSTDGNMQ